MFEISLVETKQPISHSTMGQALTCQVSSVPDDIPEVSSEELAEWLLQGDTVVLDCREIVEAKYERRTAEMDMG